MGQQLDAFLQEHIALGQGQHDQADIGHADGNFDQLQADELGLAGGQLAIPGLGEAGAIDPHEGIRSNRSMDSIRID